MKVYLDNAATTPLDAEVMKAMYTVMENNYGNPSSIHAHGREARALIEKSRVDAAGAPLLCPLADLIGCEEPSWLGAGKGTVAASILMR